VPSLAYQGGRAEVRRGDVNSNEIPRVQGSGLSVGWRVGFHDRSIMSFGKSEGSDLFASLLIPGWIWRQGDSHALPRQAWSKDESLSHSERKIAA
jgi:hypothetical protein